MSDPIGHRSRPDYFSRLATAAEEIGRLRWQLEQVVNLADDAPGLTDEQLRTRLVALAEQMSRSMQR